MTGWARYDHYATLCELLPASLPSLHCCLHLMSADHAWTEEDHSRCSRELGLKDLLPLEPHQVCGTAPEAPSYPGSEVYVLVLRFQQLSGQFVRLTNGPARNTWFNEWQIARGFLNPLQVRVALNELERLAEALLTLRRNLGEVMTKYLHGFTSDEWLGTNIDPKVSQLEQLVSSVKEKL